MSNRRVTTAVKTAVGMRNYQRARGRALTRLANAFPTEYKQFLEEEKRRDEVEGKKWHSLDHSPAHRLHRTRAGGTSTTASSYREGDTDQSNLEGEE